MREGRGKGISSIFPWAADEGEGKIWKGKEERTRDIEWKAVGNKLENVKRMTRWCVKWTTGGEGTGEGRTDKKNWGENAKDANFAPSRWWYGLIEKRRKNKLYYFTLPFLLSLTSNKRLLSFCVLCSVLCSMFYVLCSLDVDSLSPSRSFLCSSLLRITPWFGIIGLIQLPFKSTYPLDSHIENNLFWYSIAVLHLQCCKLSIRTPFCLFPSVLLSEHHHRRQRQILY